MKLEIKDGSYVLAVSGGVDSVVLLDLLFKQSKNRPKLKLIAAHFDHQIRGDSAKDKQLVEKLAKTYNLPFYFKEGKLGPQASEEQARDARYEFLWRIVKETRSDGLVTAHHQDDLIETAILNMIRGTGRRGLSSIINPKIKRPLLKYSKKQIMEYAEKNNLKWREDSTNQDTKYLRNYIRLTVMKKLTPANRKKIIDIINRQSDLNTAIDSELELLVDTAYAKDQLPRIWFNTLDHKLASEVLAFWLKENGLGSYDKKTIDRLVANIKTAKTNKKIDVFDNKVIDVKKDYLALSTLER